MVGMVDKMAAGVGVYFLLCVIAALSGYGLLRLLNLERTSGVLLLAPLGALVFWSLVLGVTGGLRLPIKEITPWLWLTTLLLAINGVPRRRSEFDSKHLPLLLVCALLPMLTMGRYFFYGLSDYLGSVAPDGWSYIAFGQYLWEYPRGAQGGLAPLYQYAAHLSETRFVAAALLGFFSPLVRAGDTQTVSSLLQAWALFNLGCAVAFWGIVQNQSPRVLVSMIAIAVTAGWITNLISASNFDNGVALAYMPALAGTALVLDSHRGGWLWLGGLLAGVLYTYPELAPLILTGAAIIALSRFLQERGLWGDWLRGALSATIVATMLLIPIGSNLLSFVQMQFASSASGGPRPGEGIFPGILDARFQPSAFWGIGSEYGSDQNIDLLNAGGFGLTILAVIGITVLVRQRQWGQVAVTILLTLGAFYYILSQRYSYGTYKLMIINWWLLAATLALGMDRVLSFIFGSSFRIGVGAGLALLVLGIATDAQVPSRSVLPREPLDATYFRQVGDVKGIVGDSPIKVLVDDWVANQWAVYYLRDIPIELGVYRMYMGQAHVVPFMRRATPIDPAKVRYTLTDAHLEQVALAQGWQRKWSGGPYILWQME